MGSGGRSENGEVLMGQDVNPPQRPGSPMRLHRAPPMKELLASVLFLGGAVTIVLVLLFMLRLIGGR